MGHQLSKWDAVIDALRAAGIPEPLGMGIAVILADAGFGARVMTHSSDTKSDKALAPIEQLVPSLMVRMRFEQSSCKETRNRQNGYSYARLAVMQKTRLKVADA